MDVLHRTMFIVSTSFGVFKLLARVFTYVWEDKMALLKCTDCRKPVSSRATMCPHCGAPSESSTPEGKASSASKVRSDGVNGALLVGGTALALLVIWFGIAVTKGSAKADEKRRLACARALTSAVGHSTAGYADKVAYEREVRDKCEGVEFDGKPVAVP